MDVAGYHLSTSKKFTWFIEEGKSKPKMGKRQLQAGAKRSFNEAKLLLTDFVVCSSGEPCVYDAIPATVLVETS